MRWLTLILVTVILALQWPLWFGKGGWVRVCQLDKQLQEQQASTEKLVIRNTTLYTEVYDLKQGKEAIEDRARNELGMIRNGEVFFQLLDIVPPTPH